MAALSRASIAALTAAALAWPAFAYTDDSVLDLSLEELIAQEVTSVAKRPQNAEEAAAAVFVLTREDIRTSHASSVTDLLRLAPGLEVAAIDEAMAAVSARGFNWRFANKLLVLVDGRAVYQPTISGVPWDQQFTPVEDFDRIEVVRGPGASLWGANAVNGVINIVTAHAADTLSQTASLRVSSDGSMRGYGRHGARLGETGAMRLWATAEHRESLVDADGDTVDDGVRSASIGARADWEPSGRDAFTLQAEASETDNAVTQVDLGTGALSTEDQTAQGFSVLGRWSRSFDASSGLTVQAFVDHISRTEFGADLEMTTFDVDASVHHDWGERHTAVFGAGYRQIVDDVMGGGAVAFTDAERTTHWTGVFAQNETRLLNDRVRLTVGVKVDDTEFSDLEVQPTARAIMLGDTWSVWGAASRAVRTPSRFETSLTYSLGELAPGDPRNPLPTPFELFVVGTPDLKPEELVAFEFGFRRRLTDHVSIDVAAYHNRYDELVTPVLGSLTPTLAPVGPMGAPIPVRFEQSVLLVNGRTGEVTGVEAVANIALSPTWNVEAFVDVRDLSQLGFDEPSGLPAELNALTGAVSPSIQASVRSVHTLSHRLDASVTVKHVGELEDGESEAYTDLDVLLAWRATDRIELRAFGDNLLEKRRLELFTPIYPSPPAFAVRRVGVQAGVRF